MGLGVDNPAWDHSTFSKNRDRLLDGEIASKFLAAVPAQPQVKRLLPSEHFSVDGTLIEAWASQKSFRPKASPDRQDDGGKGDGDADGDHTTMTTRSPLKPEKSDLFNSLLGNCFANFK